MGPKKKKKINAQECIIHFKECKDSNLVELNEERKNKIDAIALKRQSEPPGSNHRYNEVCLQIPESFSVGHGYHRCVFQCLFIHKFLFFINTFV